MLDWFKATAENWFSSFTTWFLNTSIGKFFGAFFAVAAFCWTMIGPFWDLLNFDAAMHSIADTFNSASAMAGQMPMATVIGQLNVVFPLNELLSFIGLSLGLWVLVISIKMALALFKLVAAIVQVLVSLLRK